MLVKKIKYKDYNGTEREEDFYFNLNKAEVFNLQYGKVKGGLLEYMHALSRENDVPKLVEILEDFILSAYGEKSADGKMFIKEDPETGVKPRDKFKQTEAFSELLMELVSDDKKAADFFNALAPADLIAESEKMKESQGDFNVLGSNK